MSVMQTNMPKRILDIYTRDKSDKNYKEQLKVLSADSEGLKERDVVVREHLV